MKCSEFKRRSFTQKLHFSHDCYYYTSNYNFAGASYNRTTSTNVGARCCQSETFWRILVSSASIPGKRELNNLAAETSPFDLTISLRVPKMLPFPGKCPDLIQSRQPLRGSACQLESWSRPTWL